MTTAPCLFRQERLGQKMQPFQALKFRTMKVDTDTTAHREFIRATMSASATPTGNGLYKLERPDAITPTGRWLRKTSLDELPQLLNVLRGEMSLVGPRPCLAYETETFAPHHFERFRVPAGITGLVAGNRPRPLHLRRSPRPRRRVCAQLVARPRPDALAPYAHATSSPAKGNRLMNTDSLRVAVIGLGYWGPNLVRNLHEARRRRGGAGSATSTRTRSSASAGATRPSAGRRGLDDVLNDPSVDAVAIATPVSTHAPLGLRALDAGKHVFIEKPLAASSAEAPRSDRRCRRAAASCVMPGHTFLYSPPVNMVRDLIESGRARRHLLRLDQPRQPRPPPARRERRLGSRARTTSRSSATGSTRRRARVSAISRGCVLPGTPDVAFINLEYGSGPIAHVELSWLAPSKLRRTTIVGSRKMVVYDDTSDRAGPRLRLGRRCSRTRRPSASTS